MKIGLLIIYLLLAFLFLTSPHAVHAHILKTDKDIGVLFHATPEDDPIINEPSNLFFEIKDKSQKFDPNQCDCTLTIKKENKTFLTQPLFQNIHSDDLNSPSLSFIFSEKGIYTITVSGTPKNPSEFQPFSISYDLRVVRENTTQTQKTNYIPIIIIPSIIIIFLLIVFTKKRKTN